MANQPKANTVSASEEQENVVPDPKEKITCQTLLFSLENSNGVMTTGWRESAETLMEVLLPDNVPRLDDEQLTEALNNVKT